MVEGWQEGGKLLSNTPRGYVGSRRLSLPSFSNRSLPSPLVRESLVSFALSPVRITHPLLDTGIESFRDLSHYQAATTE